MRLLPALLAACVLALPAYAQTASTGASTARARTHTHLSMQQRFDEANTSHDGHLTLEQAKAGYPAVARHFTAIDQDKKGYVTEDDIRAYYKTQRTLHHQAANGAQSHRAVEAPSPNATGG
jgi:hypothetical protein